MCHPRHTASIKNKQINRLSRMPPYPPGSFLSAFTTAKLIVRNALQHYSCTPTKDLYVDGARNTAIDFHLSS